MLAVGQQNAGMEVFETASRTSRRSWRGWWSPWRRPCSIDELHTLKHLIIALCKPVFTASTAKSAPGLAHRSPPLPTSATLPIPSSPNTSSRVSATTSHLPVAPQDKLLLLWTASIANSRSIGKVEVIRHILSPRILWAG